MRRALLALLSVVLVSVPVTLNATKSIAVYQSWHDKYVVVLETQGRNFCSGMITSIGIVTAAHCCAVGIEQGTPISYSTDGVNYSPIKTFQMDGNGNDICVIEPKYSEYSPVKIADFPSDSNGSFTDRDFMLINKISLIYNDVTLKELEVQNISRISLADEDTSIMYMQGDGMPGMSGSPILDMHGRLVGVLVVGFFRDDMRSFIKHVFGAAQMGLSQWLDSKENGRLLQ